MCDTMTPQEKKAENSVDGSGQIPEPKEAEALSEVADSDEEVVASRVDTHPAQSGPADESVVDEDSPSGDPEKLELEDALALIVELREQYLRARADVDNIRKRAEADVANARKFALEGFSRELLTVKDSLELARAVDLKALDGDNEVVVKVVEGLDLTIKQLASVFSRFSIEEVNPELGDKLDPERHQAMSVEETTDMEPDRICRVVQRGYLLNGRLLRPAMVMVAKPPKDT